MSLRALCQSVQLPGKQGRVAGWHDSLYCVRLGNHSRHDRLHLSLEPGAWTTMARLIDRQFTKPPSGECICVGTRCRTRGVPAAHAGSSAITCVLRAACCLLDCQIAYQACLHACCLLMNKRRPELLAASTASTDDPPHHASTPTSSTHHIHQSTCIHIRCQNVTSVTIVCGYRVYR